MDTLTPTTIIPKHAGGRPSKYDPALVVTVKKYIDACNRESTQLPTLAGLAIKIGVDEETLTLWAEKHEEFSVALKELTSKQKDQLMNDGLYGGKEVNQAMAIFLLKVNHKMIETANIDLTTGGLPLIQPIKYGTADNLPDSLQVRPQGSQPTSLAGIIGSTQVPSLELAQEGTEDNSRDK